MAKGLLQSPKRALIFMAGTMVSVAVLIGPEGDEGALVQATSSIQESNRDQYAPPPRDRAARPEAVREEAPDLDFASDEDLVDSAEGFDPTPEFVEPELEDPADGDVYIIDNDEG
ncbi:MAG: hypothetical protein EP341_02900 [Sphingomonadales bacterium]|nr:MAG: hypothetical protein EP341_02900 [Sphingomonadales bacterium]